MDQRAHILARNIALMTHARTATYCQALARDRTLQRLIADLITARAAPGLSQEQVALRMLTTKSGSKKLGARTRADLDVLGEKRMLIFRPLTHIRDGKSIRINSTHRNHCDLVWHQARDRAAL